MITPIHKQFKEEFKQNWETKCQICSKEVEKRKRRKTKEMKFILKALSAYTKQTTKEECKEYNKLKQKWGVCFSNH